MTKNKSVEEGVVSRREKILFRESSRKLFPVSKIRFGDFQVAMTMW